MEAPREVAVGEATPIPRPWTSAVRWARLAVRITGVIVASAVVLMTLFAAVGVPGASGASHLNGESVPAVIALDIMPVKPGGPAQNYAAYVPSTVVSAPANSVVTVTIRNFDLDATPLPAGSPYAHVRGTVGGVAYADGVAYSSLDLTNVAHTFTVPALGLSVPIPGRATDGRRYVTVTFQLRTGNAGTYAWRCFAPCGDGPEGQNGPMADDQYMRGTLVVAK